MKKILAALFAMTLIFSSAGSYVFHDNAPTAEAKKYKSGQKGFNNNNNYNTNIQNKDKNQDQATTNKNKTTNNTKSTTASKGGFMKGLMFGGLAGLLFGGLLGNMGMLGSLLGLLINAAAILFVISLIIKIVGMIKDKKRKEREAAQWHK